MVIFLPDEHPKNKENTDYDAILLLLSVVSGAVIEAVFANYYRIITKLISFFAFFLFVKMYLTLIYISCIYLSNRKTLFNGLKKYMK